MPGLSASKTCGELECQVGGLCGKLQRAGRLGGSVAANREPLSSRYTLDIGCSNTGKNKRAAINDWFIRLLPVVETP